MTCLPFLSEGSEDELEISAQNHEFSDDENSMEPAMVLPQNKNGLQLTLELSPSRPLNNSDHVNNNPDLTAPVNFNTLLESATGSPKLSIKSAEQLNSFDSLSNCDFISDKSTLFDHMNGFGALRPHVLLSNNVLPQELEVKDEGCMPRSWCQKGRGTDPSRASGQEFLTTSGLLGR